MRILLLIRNMSNIDNDDIRLAITRLNFFRSRKYSSVSVNSDELYHSYLKQVVNSIQYPLVNTDELKDMYRSINTLIHSKWYGYIANYLKDVDLHPPIGNRDERNFIMINFVHGREVCKWVLSDNKLEEEYDAICKVLIGHGIEDDFYDIIINDSEELKDISIELDMMFDNIKEEYLCTRKINS